MIYRISIMAALLAVTLCLAGCLDDEAKESISGVQGWVEGTLTQEGALLMVRRSDLEASRDLLQAVQDKSAADWEGIATLLGAIGVTGVPGVIALVKKYLKWRSVAWDAVSGLERGKMGASDGTYHVDKATLKKSIHPKNLATIEAIREKTIKRLSDELKVREARKNGVIEDGDSTA